MIQITKNDEIIAVLNFKADRYTINYLEIDPEVEAWFSLFGSGKYFSPEAGIMIPYDKEFSILSHGSSIEDNGYEFKILDR